VGQVILMSLSSYTIIASLSAIIILLLFPYSIKRKGYLGLPFPITIFLIFLWITSQIIELNSITFESKIFWANIQYIPIMFIPVCFLYLLFQFTESRHLQNKIIFFILSLVPVLGNILVWTNEKHSLIRENVFLNTSGEIALIEKNSEWVFGF
jgi:hypothetical protein